MVKRTPPLAVAVIGTGEASKKSVEALLTDFTAPYADVTFILPVTNEHFTDSVAVVADWLAENDLPYVAVTTSDAVDKTLTEHLEGADEVMKVARVSTKVVQLLKEEKGEGDVALLVLWDDEDAEAVAAVNKALAAEVPALNLLDGLDPFEFDEEAEDEARDEEVDSSLAEEGKATNAELGDEYDDWGVRKLRAALREHPNKKHTDRQIGQLDKDDAIRALRVADQAAAKGDAPAQDVEEEPEAEAPSPKAERTTRARRAFAEGVAEATGDEAQTLPSSRGGELLDEQEGGEPLQEEGELALTQAAASGGSFADEGLRHRALELAISGGKNGTEAIADAMKYEVYLRGQRQSPGRPRADGTPAQPREINPETGKPVRRRRASSTE